MSYYVDIIGELISVGILIAIVYGIYKILFRKGNKVSSNEIKSSIPESLSETYISTSLHKCKWCGSTVNVTKCNCCGEYMCEKHDDNNQSKMCAMCLHLCDSY